MTLQELPFASVPKSSDEYDGILELCNWIIEGSQETNG